MTLLRDLAGDLVEKRLWPVAAALVAAIVAVPLVLGGGGDSPARDTAAPASGGSSAKAEQTAQVRLDKTAPASIRRRSSKARNPFTSRSMPKDPGATATSASAASGAVAAPASTAGTAGAQSPQSATGSKPAQSVSKPTQTRTVTQPSEKKAAVTEKKAAVTEKKTAVTEKKAAVTDTKATARGIKYRVAWRFGVEGVQLGKHNAARLIALPSPAEPALLFLGLLKRKYGIAAVFLVKPGTQVHGEGRCSPDPASCHTLELRAGHTEFIETGSDTAGLVQYRFDVVHIDRKTVSEKLARRMRMRVSKAGRQALRAAIAAGVPGVSDFVFDRATGLLRPHVAGADD